MNMKENVLSILEKSYDALDIQTLFDALNLSTADEMRQLIKVINSMVDDFLIYQTKKDKFILYEHCPNFKKGIVQVNKSGTGFLLQEDGDIHIAKDCLNYALDGDTVVVEIVGSRTLKPEGKVIKILKRGDKNLVGTLKKGKDGLYFEATNPKKRNLSVLLDSEQLAKCVEGEVVVVTLTDWYNGKATGNIIHKIGHKDDPKVDILSIAANYDIFEEFPEDAMQQAENLPVEVRKADWVGRRDLTAENIFTIDGADTKDIDDAISLEVKDGYYILKVSIADVSYYVDKDSPLDKEAFRRGTSSYLAYSVIPMLPHKLSNGICSLNEGVERCAITCEMKIDSQGRVVSTDIYPSIIKSKKKMTYKAVNDILLRDVVEPGYEEFVDTLKDMNQLSKILRNKLVRRGYIDFDLDEAKIICDEEGRAIDVQKREREDGEKLIEMFMIAANEAVAEFIYNMDLPFVYRVHDEPREEKVQEFISFCSLVGKVVKGKFVNLTPKSFQKLLGQVDGDPDLQYVLRNMALRSMAKAVYSDENIGHFGIGSNCYTHFTSPIRRYPDLQVHRLLHTYLFNKQLDESVINYYSSVLHGITDQCSKREQAAVNAERDVDKMKMAEYMENHIGEEFDGVIVGVQNYGFYVQLNNLVEGLVAVQSLEGDYFECSPETQSMVGKHSGTVFRVGDRIRVKCMAASKEESTIDFGVVKSLKMDNTTKPNELDSEKGKVLFKKKGKNRR